MSLNKQLKFRSADNVTLLNAMQRVVQIRETIEATCVSESKAPQDLDKSLIPTELLFNLVVCFESMFYKLEHYELLDAGYPKSTKTAH